MYFHLLCIKKITTLFNRIWDLQAIVHGFHYFMNDISHEWLLKDLLAWVQRYENISLPIFTWTLSIQPLVQPERYFPRRVIERFTGLGSAVWKHITSYFYMNTFCTTSGTTRMIFPTNGYWKIYWSRFSGMQKFLFVFIYKIYIFWQFDKLKQARITFIRTSIKREAFVSIFDLFRHRFPAACCLINIFIFTWTLSVQPLVQPERHHFPAACCFIDI